MSSDSRKVAVTDGEFNAYVARPEGGGPFPAVVVIQEIFGVNSFVREVANRFAAEGFLAIAPDLFWRIEPGVDITDHSQAEWDKAFMLMNAFNVDRGVQDIQATLTAIREDPTASGKVGAVGYCLGGRLAYLTAARTDVNATVGYYGIGLDGLLDEASSIKTPLMLHIAGEDSFVPKDAQAKITEALGSQPKVTLHTYPGRDHAFARTGGAHYDPADAALADERTLTFLRQALA